MTVERINKYKQLAFNCILGWLINDIWSFIEREDFPEELKKSEQQFKNRLEEIQSLAKTLKKLRELWKGKLIIKGILNPKDALKLERLGADAIYVSGHGSRQFDSCPIPIHQLAKVRRSLKKSTVLILSLIHI